MEEVEVERVRPEALQTPLASLDRARAGGVGGAHFGGEIAPLAAAPDGLAHDLFDFSRTIELGRIDVRQAGAQARLEGADTIRAIVPLHVPRPLADDGGG